MTNVKFAILTVGVGALLAGGLTWFHNEDRAKHKAALAILEERMSRTLLVRVCVNGTKIYRREGRLMTVSAFGEDVFAPDILLEQACPAA